MITLGDKWGLSPVEITVEDESVTFYSVSTSGAQMSIAGQTPDQGGPGTINDVNFEVLAVQGKKAVIMITHE
ncbi:hypothetical protein FDA94_01145 [Herbidospora galbida]|uniref:Uncharacterized protein n=1 Tax=Herbidospora galbida TaxID=2575442 RepID=A0A4U3MSS8_9ACTN|nr:hypothetical protein [Herbidospora galbida]TKK91426.1 hypothetical protein FDA94_01145 [Herbidospora galbida]